MIADAIKNSQNQTNQLKRKYTTDEDSNVQVESASSLLYRQGMEFVESFKKARIEKG